MLEDKVFLRREQLSQLEGKVQGSFMQDTAAAFVPSGEFGQDTPLGAYLLVLVASSASNHTTTLCEMCPPRESELGCSDVVRHPQKSCNRGPLAEQFCPLKGFTRHHINPFGI